MLAVGFWHRSCVLVITAVLLVVSASAQVPVDPDENTASVETDKPADPMGIESNLEASDSPEPEPDLEEEVGIDTLEQLSDTDEIPVTGYEAAGWQKPPAARSITRDLQALRVKDITDLADYTPNLEINTALAASNPTISIRGIGLRDHNANVAGPVAVYQDGININSPVIQFGQFFDLERIDVLRGPQGSVNGRNATAGAIMIRSALPDGEFGVSTNLTYGNYDNKQVEAAINIPLIKDRLSMRVSGTAQFRDGYTKNQCAGWTPEAHINPATGEPFRRIDQDTTRALYGELIPAGQYELNPDTGEYEIRPVKYLKGNGSIPTRDGERILEFIFLNEDLAIGRTEGTATAAWRYTIGVGVNNLPKPFRLDEDLIDENGNPVVFEDPFNPGTFIEAKKGLPIATMLNTLAISDADDICMHRPPGKVATLFGEWLPRNSGDPNWLEGNWQPDRVQPGLEDFAKLKRWTNNIDNWAARMVLLFEPLDNMEWMLNFHGSQNRGDSAHLQMLGATARHEIPGFFEDTQDGFSENGAAIRSGFKLGEGVRSVKGVVPFNQVLNGEGGGNPYSGFYDKDGIEYVDAWGINGRGIWDLGAVVITLLYDYEWYDRVIEDEGDANPLRVFPATWSNSAWQTTEELRVEGEGERYKWTTGFFFLYEELTANNFLPDPQQGFEVNQDFSQELTSWAPYASAELELVEEGVIPGIYQLTLGGGVRYNREKKKFSLVGSLIETSSGASVVELPEDTQETTWKELTGEVQLSYTPFLNKYGSLLSYVSYGRGFKSGDFNAGLTIAGSDARQDIDPVEPEFIDAVEFGIRSRWFDDRVILNAAVFRYWYKDLQVFDIVNEALKVPIPKLLNGDAEILGGEAELRVRPVPGLLISASGGWLDSEFGDFKVTKTVLSRRGTLRPHTFDYEGNVLVGAPEWNFAGFAEFEVPLFGWGSLVPRWDLNFRSNAYFDPQMLDPISQDGYWIHNARIAYQTPNDRLELAFWVSNLFEEEYKVDVFDLSRENNTILEVWGEPRTYGVTLSLNW